MHYKYFHYYLKMILEMNKFNLYKIHLIKYNKINYVYMNY